MSGEEGSLNVRQHRVTAFCDWLCTIPAEPPYRARPEFRFYADLTSAERAAAGAEMRRRGEAQGAEADALQRYYALRFDTELEPLAAELGSPKEWFVSAVDYLRLEIANAEGGSAHVSVAALGLVLDRVMANHG